MDKPLVSVVIPTHNRPQLLQKAVESVLNQTYPNLEVIIVDDNSSDNTPEIGAELAQDDRVQYIRLNENLGAPVARNTGIKKARGKYIGLLDDDDQYLPTKIDKQVELFEKSQSEVGLVYGSFEIIETETNRKRTKQAKYKGDIYPQLLRNCFIGSPTVLIRKECFEKVGDFDPTLPSCQDWDMWSRISQQYQADYVEEPIAQYFLHGGKQITTDYQRRMPGVRKVFVKHYPDLKKQPKLLRYRIKNLAKHYACAGQKKEALIWYSKLITLQPFSKDNWKRLFLTLFNFKNYQKRVQGE